LSAPGRDCTLGLLPRDTVVGLSAEMFLEGFDIEAGNVERTCKNFSRSGRIVINGFPSPYFISVAELAVPLINTGLILTIENDDAESD
jgi:hypothetical protein